LQQSDNKPKPWEIAIVNRRRAVVRKLLGAAAELRKEGDEALSAAVERYAKELPRLETERHQMKRAIVAQVQQQRKTQALSHQQADIGHNAEQER
jgi:type IV secretion system T-DNA border endonuclease VirD2